MTKWEQEWSTTTKGEITRSFFPSVLERMKTHIPLNGNVTTLLTGHGRIGSFFFLFKIKEDPTCICGAPDQTVDHILFHCPNPGEERSKFRSNMLQKWEMDLRQK